MRILLIFLMLGLISGCSDPKDIIFGPEPLKQIAEQGDQFKKLSENDRTLLVGYLTVTEMGKAFGSNIKPATGRTVAEVLTDARSWKDKMDAVELEAKLKREAAEVEAKKQKAEAEALKTKIIAERKEIADKISASVVVAVIDKTVLPKNYEAGRFREMLSLKYAIQNKSEKTIKQLKGRVRFKDAVGDEIGWLSVNIDEPIKPDQTLKTTTGRGWEISPISNDDVEKIAYRDFNSMQTNFEPESIAFEGGDILKAPNLPD